MSPLNSNSKIEVARGERWSIYHRLQELQIPCVCGIGKPLEAEIASPLSALLLWSVVQSATKNRQELVSWLNQCWQSKIDNYK